MGSTAVPAPTHVPEQLQSSSPAGGSAEDINRLESAFAKPDVPRAGTSAPAQHGPQSSLPPSASPSELSKLAAKPDTVSAAPTAAEGQSTAQIGAQVPNGIVTAAGPGPGAAQEERPKVPEAAASLLSAEQTGKAGAPAASKPAAGGGGSKEGLAATKVAPGAVAAGTGTAAAGVQLKPAAKEHPSGAAQHHVAASKPPAGGGNSKPGPSAGGQPVKRKLVIESDSDDDVPLAMRQSALAAQKPKAAPKPAAPKAAPKPAAVKATPKHASAAKGAAEQQKNGKKRKQAVVESEDESEDESEEEEEEEDDRPAKKPKKVDNGSARHRAENGKAEASEAKPRKKRKAAPREERAVRRTSSREQKKAEDKSVKWDTLRHNGVLFPPEYTPHGIKMLYDGRPVDLTPEQEEIATAMAAMQGTAYLEKKQFLENFWAAFKPVLGKGHAIRDLAKCDFSPIQEWRLAEREKAKAAPKPEKERLKAEKEAAEAKYKWALVDGRREQVGNFRVEPPGLFRGRGDHPKMGQYKRRIYPRDITINIGKGEPVPEHPYPGQGWKEVRHDNTVTWLAFWKDSISQKDYKYVWLAANSTFKSDSDLAKYEKARKLKDYIGGIRRAYEADWGSKSVQARQMAVALYFIDKLALRAGHEKDEDEADTVGCCTLKVENVEVMGDNHIRFDFLGKDSIRYENEVAVHPTVHALVKDFCRHRGDGTRKKPDDQVFDTMNATDLNTRLKDLMDGLSVKVFRTYNASVTLDALLHKESAAVTLDERKAEYDRANKEVAILCNHQRAVPKGHSGQMQKMGDKLLRAQQELDDLQAELKAALKGDAKWRSRSRMEPVKVKKEEGKVKEEDGEEKLVEKGKKPARAEDTVRNLIARKKEMLARMELTAKVKEDLKTVALGTSKINYLDPRITIAWCKLHEVPIEKIFNKSLLSKFHWSMECEPDFRF